MAGFLQEQDEKYKLKWLIYTCTFIILRFIKRKLPQTISYRIKQINIEFIAYTLIFFTLHCK